MVRPVIFIVVRYMSPVEQRRYWRYISDQAGQRITGNLTINFLSSIPNLAEHFMYVLLKDLQVADASLDELRPDQLPAVVPGLAIGSEDAINIRLGLLLIHDQVHSYESPKNSCQSRWKGSPLP